MPLGRRGARALASRFVYEVGTVVGQYPSLALPVARWRRHGEPFGSDTDVVIEGYPRSANNFAVAAFASAQPGPVRIAHHVHAPAHAIEAVRRGLPTLVLIREPEYAVVELVLLKSALTLHQALRGWIRFYRPLVPYRRRFVVARTEEVLADFGVVIGRLNERFGTSFGEVVGSEDAVRAAERGIGHHREGREGPGLPFIGRTRETEEGRKADRERLRREYRSVRLAALRDRAGRLHETFTNAAR